jgi:hypothetical protein
VGELYDVSLDDECHSSKLVDNNIFISNQGNQVMSQEGHNIKGSLVYYLHVDTLINVYHKEEVISSACATE